VADQTPQKREFPPNAIHLVRTAQQIHVQLSAMADTKASILMGATFVIFTITIGQARGSSAPLPLLILGASAFFAAVFAVLAVLPATRQRKPSGEPNILFFGTFTQMAEEEFIDTITSRLHRDETIYRTMARDVYQNGRVLQRKKYRMLAYAYRTFLAGLVASCIAYVVIYLR
jgi:hypothetical protein